MELIKLQCSNELKSKVHAEGVSLLDFYKKYIECKRYPNFIKHAKKMVSVFGSTYACEQLFSSMKFIKSKLRTQLTDDHLQDVILALTEKKIGHKNTKTPPYVTSHQENSKPKTEFFFQSKLEDLPNPYGLNTSLDLAAGYFGKKCAGLCIGRRCR